MYPEDEELAPLKQFTVSGISTCECFCYDSDRLVGAQKGAACDIRLSCYCGVHYDCLIRYIQNKIGDRLSMNLCGIECPYGRECNQYSMSSNANSCYYLTLEDLDGLVDYGNAHPELNNELGFEPLTHEKVQELRHWIIDEDKKEIHSLPVYLKSDEDPYILATTKGCPSCSVRTSHYHGHSCHHISPARAPKRGGCPNCHVNYCYRCLKTEEENTSERGTANACQCGFWSNFCSPFNTMNDLKYLKLHPVPHDTRCGCVLCPDCAEDQPCANCPGNCVVCLGILKPGPLELGVKWKPKRTLASWNCEEYLLYNLFESCRLGDHDELATVLKKTDTKIDLNSQVGNDQLTPLHYACASGSLKCVKILLDDPRLDVDRTEKHGLAPIHVACWRGNLDMVVELVKRNAGYTNYWGLTALHVASEHGHLPIVDFLLNKGSDLDAKTARGQGEAPLHYACRNGHLHIVKLLLVHNASVSVKNIKNATPLHRAIESGYFDIVQCLVNNKSVIDRRAIAIANAGNNYRVMNYLSVHEYSSKGHIECLIKLVTCYPKLVHAIDEEGCTPLHRACEYGWTDSVRFLTSAGANINAVDKLHWTPMHRACSSGHIEAVRLLVKKNANVLINSETNESVADVAGRFLHLHVTKYLQDVHPELFHKQQQQKPMFVDIRCKKGTHAPSLSLIHYGKALSAYSSSSEVVMSPQQLSSKEKFFYKEAISLRDCFPGILKG